MNLLNGYVTKALLRSVLLVWVVLTLLISLAALVKELDDVGEGRYGILDALAVVGWTVPARFLELAPVSGLVGGMLALSGLAAHGELLAMGAAGASPWRLTGSAVRSAIWISLLMVALAEWVLPIGSQEAARRRSLTTDDPGAAITASAVWLRDAGMIARVGSVRSGGELSDVQVFRFDASAGLTSVTSAESGRVERDGRWTLWNVRRDVLTPGVGEAQREELPSLTLSLPDRFLNLLVGQPGDLALSRIWEDSHRSDLTAEERESLQRVLWQRVSLPFLLLSMMALAVPLVAKRTEPRAFGRRLAQGVVLGVLTHVGVQVISYLGALANLDPGVVALGPAILIGILGLLLMVTA